MNPQIPTIFEDLAKKGLKSGSVNGLIYRGSSDHLLSFPLWIHVPPALPNEIKVKGPDFLYVYFPDLDSKLHKRGPSNLDGVIRTDKQLQSLLQAFGSRKEALKKAAIMVMGDNGMTRVLPANEQPAIDLNQILKGYDVLRPGAAVTGQTEIILAINDRMAYLYKLKPHSSFEQSQKT